jgi:hypothetical protein
MENQTHKKYQYMKKSSRRQSSESAEHKFRLGNYKKRNVPFYPFIQESGPSCVITLIEMHSELSQDEYNMNFAMMSIYIYVGLWTYDTSIYMIKILWVSLASNLINVHSNSFLLD